MSAWDYLSKRRGITLVDFVEGAQTLSEAHEVFRRKKVTPPVDGSLEALFEKPPASDKSVKDTVKIKQAKVESTEDVKSENVKNEKDWGIVKSKATKNKKKKNADKK